MLQLQLNSDKSKSSKLRLNIDHDGHCTQRVSLSFQYYSQILDHIDMFMASHWHLHCRYRSQVHVQLWSRCVVLEVSVTRRFARVNALHGLILLSYVSKCDYTTICCEMAFWVVKSNDCRASLWVIELRLFNVHCWPKMIVVVCKRKVWELCNACYLLELLKFVIENLYVNVWKMWITEKTRWRKNHPTIYHSFLYNCNF